MVERQVLVWYKYCLVYQYLPLIKPVRRRQKSEPHFLGVRVGSWAGGAPLGCLQALTLLTVLTIASNPSSTVTGVLHALLPCTHCASPFPSSYCLLLAY